MIISKYCASGNDFLIFHSFLRKDYSTLAIEHCNRFYGIGADGLVVVLPLQGMDGVSYEWDFYNCDGSKADMCGNASRAVSTYAYRNNLATLKHSFLSKAGIIDTTIEKIIDSKKTIVKSNLGTYSLLDSIVEKRHGKDYFFYNVIMRIPHIVYKTNSKEEFVSLSKDVEFLSILRHKYNANVNIAFMDNDSIKYCTFERGVEGITQACGTGACAVYVAYGIMHKELTLIPPSGENLIVSYKNDCIYFSGMVHKICDCII